MNFITVLRVQSPDHRIMKIVFIKEGEGVGFEYLVVYKSTKARLFTVISSTVNVTDYYIYMQ
jgi:hypothetical protein